MRTFRLVNAAGGACWLFRWRISSGRPAAGLAESGSRAGGHIFNRRVSGGTLIAGYQLAPRVIPATAR